MSQNALRYRVTDIGSFRKEGNPYRLTRHHVPPRHPDAFPRTIKVDERRHRAYHLLFANAASLEDCISILKRDWWRI